MEVLIMGARLLLFKYEIKEIITAGVLIRHKVSYGNKSYLSLGQKISGNCIFNDYNWT